MNALLMDPIVLICVGTILIGLVVLVWAFGKLFSSKGASAADEPFDLAEMTTPPEEEFPSLELKEEPASPPLTDVVHEPAPAPAPPPPPPPPPPSPAPPPAQPAVNKDVAMRLDVMTQRLGEMQAVLSKQSAAVPASVGAPEPAAGPGFSPDTVDKLLKIIANVIQQVDILQKSLDITPAAKPSSSGETVPPKS